MPYLQPNITNYGITPLASIGYPGETGTTGATGTAVWQGTPLFEPASGIQGVPPGVAGDIVTYDGVDWVATSGPILVGPGTSGSGIAIGNGSVNAVQSQISGIAIGQAARAGDSSADVNNIAIGKLASCYRNNGICIGLASSAGLESISIGPNISNVNGQSIALNATASLSVSTLGSFNVKPVASGATSANLLYYNAANGEVTYSTPPTGVNGQSLITGGPVGGNVVLTSNQVVTAGQPCSVRFDVYNGGSPTWGANDYLVCVARDGTSQALLGESTLVNWKSTYVAAISKTLEFYFTPTSGSVTIQVAGNNTAGAGTNTINVQCDVYLSSLN